MKIELTFKSQARIIRTLGDRLISGEVAAVIELVKNAYDADAANCFIEINPHENVLMVRDDGHGMSVEDIQTKWTELGTDNKYRNKLSKYNKRRVLGDKGIGRLAASKLGRHLKVNSTIKEEGAFRSILVDGLDWNAFLEKEDTYIDDVKFYVEEISAASQTGTVLTVSDLNQEWENGKLEILIKELRKLISPRCLDDNDFNIYLNLDAFTVDKNGFNGSELINGVQTQFSKTSDKKNIEKDKVEAFPVLDACDYTFEAEYSKNKLQGVLKINDVKTEHSIKVEIDQNISLGNGRVQLNIFDRDSDSVKNTFIKAGAVSKEDKKQFSLRDARHYLDGLSGIAIYRNNFRIRPYGDKDSDWLSLDKRRIQNPSKNLEQAQISGLIVVDTVEESGLIERSSRENFEHNDNYAAFKELLLKALNEIEVLRLIHNDQTGKNRKHPDAAIKSAFSLLREKTNLNKLENFKNDIPKEKQEEFNGAVSEYKTSLDKLIDIIQERQAILEARSTLGFILAEVVHEAKHPTSAIGSNLISLTKRVKNKWQEDITPMMSETLLDNFAQDIGHVKELETLLKRLDPLINVRRKKSYEFSVYETIKKSLLLYQERAKRLGITINHEHPQDDCKMNGLEVDLSTAVINLIDNALYWHEQRKIKSPFINISYDSSKKVLRIFVEDNAGKISEKYQDAIFNVGFTTKDEGSGLGLSIAREALGRAGASIHHKNTASDGSLFTIEARMDI